jgi:outer membrane protein
MCPLIAGTAEGETVMTLSLRDALVMARERHADIIMADERVQQAAARMGQSQSGLFPQVHGVVSGSRQSRDLRGQGIALPGDPHIGPFNAFDARIKMTQAIFDPAAVARLDAASKGRQLSLAEQRKVDQDVLALVATLYINARQSAERLKAQGVILQSEESLWKTVQTKLRQGTATLLEADQAKSRYSRNYFIWRQMSSEETQARLDLYAALDLPFDQKIAYSNEDISFQWDEQKPDSLNDHPDVKLADQNVRLKTAERGLERAQWLPQVSGIADYGKAGEGLDESSNTYTVGLQASIPIWEGGNREKRIKEASSRVRESEVNLDAIKRETKARVLAAIETMKQAEAFKDQAKDQIKAAEVQENLAYKKFEMGNGSKNDIYDGQAAKASAEANEADALAAYQSAQVNLAHALGRIDDLLETSNE